MCVDMFPGFDIHLCMTDRKAVFDDVHALRNINKRDFMTGRDLLFADDRLTFQIDRCSGSNGLKRDRYIVIFMNSDKIFHNNSLIIQDAASVNRPECFVMLRVLQQRHEDPDGSQSEKHKPVCSKHSDRYPTGFHQKEYASHRLRFAPG